MHRVGKYRAVIIMMMMTAGKAMVMMTIMMIIIMQKSFLWVLLKQEWSREKSMTVAEKVGKVEEKAERENGVSVEKECKGLCVWK